MGPSETYQPISIFDPPRSQVELPSGISCNDNDYLTATLSLPEPVAFWSSIWHRRGGWQGANCRSGCGCSSGVEHNLAKVGVEGSNPFARSSLLGRPPVCLLSECGGWHVACGSRSVEQIFRKVIQANQRRVSSRTAVRAGLCRRHLHQHHGAVEPQ